MLPCIFLLVLCFTTIHEISANSVNYLGCYKFKSKPIGCRLKSEEAQTKLSNRITTSLANGIQWIREQQKSGRWIDVSTSSWVMANMILAGYVNDSGICTKTMQDGTISIRQSLVDVADISAGGLAMTMLGMRATCQDVTNFNHRNLVEVMTDNMASFPQDDFNNFYQYSLGVLALYVNGVDVPEEYGNKLIQYLFHVRNQDIKDTQALSLIALSSIMRQKGNSVQFLIKARKVTNGAVKRIERQLETGEMKNLVTLTHVLQVIQLQKTSFSEKADCEKLMTSILAKQDKFGSFGGLMTSVGLLPLLSGISLLELRNMNCPIPKDDVEESKIEKFIKSRRTKPHGNHVTRSEVVEKVDVTIESAVDSIKVGTHTQSLALKKDTTVLSALRRASKRDDCFRFHVRETAWGPYVDSICGITQNDREKRYWMFYVNGKLASVGVGAYVLKHKDAVVFRYQTVS